MRFSASVGLKLSLFILCCSICFKVVGSENISVEDFFSNISYEQLPLHEMAYIEPDDFKAVQAYVRNSPEYRSKVIEGLSSKELCCLERWNANKVKGVRLEFPAREGLISVLERTESNVLVLKMPYGGKLEFYVLEKSTTGALGVMNLFWPRHFSTYLFDLEKNGQVTSRELADYGLGVEVFDNDILSEAKKFKPPLVNSRQNLFPISIGTFQAQVNGRYQARWDGVRPDFDISFVWNGKLFELKKVPVDELDSK